MRVATPRVQNGLEHVGGPGPDLVVGARSIRARRTHPGKGLVESLAVNFLLDIDRLLLIIDVQLLRLVHKVLEELRPRRPKNGKLHAFFFLGLPFVDRNLVHGRAKGSISWQNFWFLLFRRGNPPPIGRSEGRSTGGTTTYVLSHLPDRLELEAHTVQLAPPTA